MAIVETMTETTFISRFRESRPDNFSYEGLQAIFEYFDELSDDTGESIEFDPIAICCDFGEYTEQETKDTFDYLMSDKDSYEFEELLEEISDRTTILEITDYQTQETRYIISSF